MDNGSTPPPPQYDSHSSSPPQQIFSRCLNFLSETRSRVLQTFVRPVTTFPHTPLNSQGIKSLNYPFRPVSPFPPSNGNDDGLSGDSCGVVTITATLVDNRPLTSAEEKMVDRLEEKVTDLEQAVKDILGEDTNTGTNNNGQTQGLSFEELDKFLPPPQDYLGIRDKLPPNIYQEIIAIYEESLHESGVGGRDATTSTTEADLKQPSSRNKERNVRCEVLKSDKDW